MSTVILRISPRFCRGRLSPLHRIRSSRFPSFPASSACSSRLFPYLCSRIYLFFSACHSRDRRKTETYKTESENLPEFGLWIEIERYAAGTGWRKKSLASALQSLYHILRIWQPPAEFSARLSAVHAETGMRRYNARSAVIIPCRAVWCPEGSLRFCNFCSFNACFSVLPDCLQIVAGF